MFVYRMDTPERVTVKTFSDGEVVGDLVNVSCDDKERTELSFSGCMVIPL